jgi:hypothetical protein
VRECVRSYVSECGCGCRSGVSAVAERCDENKRWQRLVALSQRASSRPAAFNDRRRAQAEFLVRGYQCWSTDGKVMLAGQSHVNVSWPMNE